MEPRPLILPEEMYNQAVKMKWITPTGELLPAFPKDIYPLMFVSRVEKTRYLPS